MTCSLSERLYTLCRALQNTFPRMERMHRLKSIGYIGLYEPKTILPLHGPSQQVFKRCVEEYSPNDPNEDFQGLDLRS